MRKEVKSKNKKNKHKIKILFVVNHCFTNVFFLVRLNKFDIHQMNFNVFKLLSNRLFLLINLYNL